METAGKLNDRQLRFCEEYLIDNNATQAAIRAGYSEKTAQSIGAENLTKPLIKEYLSAKQKESSERLKIDADFVKLGFLEIYERSMKKKPNIDSAGANKALENIAKLLGFFEKDNMQKMPPASISIEIIPPPKENF